jgi:drug/metabolite transporter (DMT)-like permease
MVSSKLVKGYIFVFLGVLCWGIAAPVAKLLFTRNYDSFLIIQSRATFSFLAVFLYLFIFKRKLFKINPKDMLLFFLLGIIGMAGSNFFYYTAIGYVSVSTAIMIQYTTPFLVMLYAVIAKIEKVHYWKFLLLFMAFIALFFAVSGGNLNYFTINLIGILLSIASALTWAFFNIFNKHIKTRYDNWTEIFYIFAAVSLLWFFVKPSFVLAVFQFDYIDFLILVPFALFSVLIPMTVYNIGLRYLKASQATALGLLEPVIVVIASFFIINEKISIIQGVSMSIVLLSIYFLEYFREKIDHHEN